MVPSSSIASLMTRTSSRLPVTQSALKINNLVLNSLNRNYKNSNRLNSFCELRHYGSKKNINSYTSMLNNNLATKFNFNKSSTSMSSLSQPNKQQCRNINSKKPKTDLNQLPPKKSTSTASTSESSSSAKLTSESKTESSSSTQPDQASSSQSSATTAILSTLAMIVSAAGIGGYIAYDDGNNKENLQLATLSDVANLVTKGSDPAPVDLADDDIDKQLVNLNPITDEIFDHSDDLLVIVVGNESWFQNPIYKRNVKKLVKEITEKYDGNPKPGLGNLGIDGDRGGSVFNRDGVKITPYYTVQEGLMDVESTGSDPEKIVKFMCYKGHRKQHFTWFVGEGTTKVDDDKKDKKSESTDSDAKDATSTDDTPLKSMSDQELLYDESWARNWTALVDFYKFRSLPNFEIEEKGVQTISANQFQEFVLDDSHHWPVLLQLYEETCFLCFLMRPMIQTLSTDRDNFPLPCRIMRFNVEENDFPKDLPMARGTPQFYLFHKGKCRRWTEFKPMDLVEKICSGFELSGETKGHMQDLADKVQSRFQMFTALVMWHMELKKMEDELQQGNFNNGSGSDGVGKGTDDTEPNEEQIDSLIERANKKASKDDGFNSMVSTLMTEDMQRHDDMDSNMSYLQNEINEIEKDVCLLGMMLGKMVQGKEKAVDSREELEGIERLTRGEGATNEFKSEGAFTNSHESKTGPSETVSKSGSEPQSQDSAGKKSITESVNIGSSTNSKSAQVQTGNSTANNYSTSTQQSQSTVDQSKTMTSDSNTHIKTSEAVPAKQPEKILEADEVGANGGGRISSTEL